MLILIIYKNNNFFVVVFFVYLQCCWSLACYFWLCSHEASLSRISIFITALTRLLECFFPSFVCWETREFQTIGVDVESSGAWCRLCSQLHSKVMSVKFPVIQVMIIPKVLFSGVVNTDSWLWVAAAPGFRVCRWNHLRQCEWLWNHLGEKPQPLYCALKYIELFAFYCVYRQIMVCWVVEPIRVPCRVAVI